ncbi:MAG: hypothetical protein KF770_10620 [Anaerolineae bacterium]|nr:hypothetical protein [Anaerolineae bacterium]
MYVIYQVIDPTTGEVVRYTAELADQVQELRAARRVQVRGQLHALGSFHPHQGRELRPAPADTEAELWRLFQGGGL